VILDMPTAVTMNTAVFWDVAMLWGNLLVPSSV